MTTSIKDVAKLAGVSPKTVSRVINGEAHVRPEKRDAVMEAVKRLDYRPNVFARSLSSSRSFLIGLFSDDPGSAYAADIHIGALRRCREQSYHLVMEPIDREQPDWMEGLRSMLLVLRLDGVILTPPLCDDVDLLSLIEASGIPYVRISPGSNIERAPFVTMDDAAAAREMTHHLIAQGHSRIGFVKGDPAHMASAKRFAGFVTEMERHGLAPDAALIAQGDFSARSGLACAERLLDSAVPPSAIFASNDDMAVGVLMTATRRRLDVPGQLAIAGFDDAPFSRAAWPQITTIRQPKREMAAAAVDLLTDGRSGAGPAGGGGAAQRSLSYELLVRGSTVSAAAIVKA